MVGLSVRPILDFLLPLLFFGGVMGLRKLKGAPSTIRKERKIDRKAHYDPAATGIGGHTQKEDKSESMESTCISPKVLICSRLICLV